MEERQRTKTKVFAYPPDLRDGIRRARRWRMAFWCGVMVLCFILVPLGELIAYVILAGLAGMISILELPIRTCEGKSVEWRNQTIELEDQRLLQKDGGQTIAWLDLARPYRVSYPYHALGNAVYRVRQHDAGKVRSVRFTTYIDNAEELVRDVLQQHEWPPGDESAA